LHDGQGLASDWARNVKVGDRVGLVEFALPSGHRTAIAYKAEVFVFSADEASLPAAQTNLEAFDSGAKVVAFFEVANMLEDQSIDAKADLTSTWLHRGDAGVGTSGLLLNAIRELPWPEGKIFVWACGEMRMASEIRQFIIEERGLGKGDFKCQAYWRRGMTEVQRMERMTELTLAAAEANPEAFQESFENIGMDIVDPSLLDGPEQGKELQTEHPRLNTITEANHEKNGFDSLDNVWEITMQTPLGTQKAIVYFAIEGSSIVGKMDSPAGSANITDGVIRASTIAWKTKLRISRSLTLEFKAQIDVDAISGKVKLGPIGNASFKGSRFWPNHS
jgi:Siderophore-interacting protein